MISPIASQEYTQAAQAAARANAVSSQTDDTRAAASVQASSTSSRDTVSFSEAAKALSNLIGKYKGKVDEDETDGSSSDPADKIKKKIKELQEKIVKTEQSDMPADAKQGVVKGLETEMAALTQELAQLTSKSSASPGGSGGGSGLSSSAGSVAKLGSRKV